jgi:probable selenate reductase FAD-binding subunit
MLLNLQHYHRPTDLDQAVALLRQGAPGTVVLAGGTTLLASKRRDVQAVVDLRDLPLAYTRTQGATLHVGATTTLQNLADAPDLQEFSSGVLAQMAGAIANRNIRNAATLGGCVASAGGENPLLAALLALDAEVVVHTADAEDDGPRRIPLTGFLNYRQQLLAEGALIGELRLPLLIGPLGAAVASVARTPRDRPIVCAIARLELAKGIAANVRLALGGVAPMPVRARKAEQTLERKKLDEERIAQAAGLAAEGLEPPGDFRGSAEYRREMAGVLARRALAMARALAGETSVG